ncbi:MAG: protein tyrosine phosphatase family protein [Caldilineaceae bacterium]
MQPLAEIRAFLQLSNRVATSGQPTAEQFAAVKDAGYEIVVNLALATSPDALADEEAIVTQQGLDYTHIPVIWEAPQAADFAQFMATMQAHQDQKVFVHCIANKRVSAFMYLYRRYTNTVEPERAWQDLQRIWTPNEVWQQFIEQMTRQLPPTGKPLAD